MLRSFNISLTFSFSNSEISAYLYNLFLANVTLDSVSYVLTTIKSSSCDPVVGDNPLPSSIILSLISSGTSKERALKFDKLVYS